MKIAKKYIITCRKDTFTTREYKSSPMTLEEAIKHYGYTLSTGKSYEREKGNKKINLAPKTMKSLMTNLENAANNAASSGYAGTTYTYEEVSQ